jgi:hypothetical protein
VAAGVGPAASEEKDTPHTDASSIAEDRLYTEWQVQRYLPRDDYCYRNIRLARLPA